MNNGSQGSSSSKAKPIPPKLEHFQSIVKQIYESDESTHAVDFKYSHFFTKLAIPVECKKNPPNIIRTIIMKIERNDKLVSPTLFCYLTPSKIMIADCAIKEGHMKGMFKHLRPDTVLHDLPLYLIPTSIQHLPNIALMMTGLTKFTHEMAPYSIKNDPVLAIALALIESVYQGFWTKYEHYLENPDAGIRVIDNSCNFNANWGKFYFCGFLNMNRTEDEKKFVAFMIILSIFKPMNASLSAGNARKKRYQVIQSMLKSLPANQDDKFIDIFTMQHLAKHFSQLPKLKSMILSCAVLMVRASKCEAIHEYLLKILIPLEMILFIIIDEFVGMPEKTKAHSHSKIIQEIHYFLYTKQELIKKFGDNIYFAKLLDPKITEVNVAKWKHLGALAMMSANVKYPKTEQLKILGLKYEIDFPELLMQKVKTHSGGRTDSVARDSDLFLKAMYGN